MGSRIGYPFNEAERVAQLAEVEGYIAASSSEAQRARWQEIRKRLETPLAPYEPFKGFPPELDVVISPRAEIAKALAQALHVAACDRRAEAHKIKDNPEASERYAVAGALDAIGGAITRALANRQNLERARAENAAKRKEA